MHQNVDITAIGAFLPLSRYIETAPTHPVPLIIRH